MKFIDKVRYTIATAAMMVIVPVSYADASGALPQKLGGLDSIAKDVQGFIQWLIWIGGPILFLLALWRYMKTNDANDKKQAKNWMVAISITFIAAQIAVWFLQVYLAGKFK